jgi:Domain of unknown function (DUF4157)/Novel toxin 16
MTRYATHDRAAAAARWSPSPLHRRATSHVWSHGSTAPPVVHEVLSTPGHEMDRHTRLSMESRFRQDFSHVRLHTDQRAALSADAVDASAYTVGSHVVFGREQYQPSSVRGNRLLAHELTHVIQQQDAPATGPLTLSDSGESEARAAETHVARADAAIGDPGSRALGLARRPRSLNQSLDASQMTDTELELEINEIRRWLRGQSRSSAESGQLATTLATFGQELLRRHPEAQPAQSGAAPLAIGLVSANGIARAEAAIATRVAAGSAVGTTAGAGGTTAAGEGLATAGTSVGAVFAGAIAFIAVLFWPNTSIVSGDEERRMLEEDRRRQESQPRTRDTTRDQPRATPRSRRCTEAEFNTLYELVKAGCNQPRSCTMQGDTCASATAKVAAGYACTTARENLQRNCFQRGDPGYEGHMEQIAQAYAALRACQEVMSAKCQ